MTTIITNSSDQNLKKVLILLASKADRIDIAVAFFSESQLLKKWEQEKKKINLIVSLRPTTNYFSLKDIQSSINIEVNFLGKDFHSKFLIFYNKGVAISAILGSSNFTPNGLSKNIETNIFIDDTKVLSNLQDHFNDLLQESNLLQPSDLDSYKSIYLKFLASRKKADEELNKFKTKITKNRAKRKAKIRISKVASEYYEYWNIVDEIQDWVKNISDKHYPNVPYYLVLDSFWHWVVVTWNKETGKTLNRSNQKKEIPKLFTEFIRSDTNEGPKEKKKRSKQIFQVYLSQKNIDKLTKQQAKIIFRNLHSTYTPIKRFQADDKFIEENSIQQIRTSFKYLLYSNDDIVLRIHNLLKTPKYKLKRLGPSGVQEINGWTRPTEFPIRNGKLDNAVKILGYKLD